MSHASIIVAPTREQIDQLGVEQAVAWEMEPFEESSWFEDGSRWDWYVIGGRWEGMLAGRNIVQLKDLSIDAVRKQREGWQKEAYENYKSRENHPFSDIEGDETLEQYVARKCGKVNPVHSYAFLRNRHWHEPERMGWFGTTTFTECERKDMDKVRANPDAWFGKCLHKDEKTGSQIVCWNEPYEFWQEQYFHRFIEPLKAEETIIVVDYHV
jgi:hypothetical protein